MPADLTMCSGEGCPLRRSCYRHRAIPSAMRQDYFATPPYRADDEGCASYQDVEGLRPTEDEIRKHAYHLWSLAGRPARVATQFWLKAEAEMTQLFHDRLREPVEYDEDADEVDGSGDSPSPTDAAGHS
ncbi:MAG: DUF2934 domain-containing protein [Myxococcota bacterium]